MNKKVSILNKDPDIWMKTRVFLNKCGFPNAEFKLAQNGENENIVLSSFRCKDCENCDKGEICKDDPPTLDEINSVSKKDYEIEKKAEEKKNDIFYQNLLKYIKPECFIQQ